MYPYVPEDQPSLKDRGVADTSVDDDTRGITPRPSVPQKKVLPSQVPAQQEEKGLPSQALVYEKELTLSARWLKDRINSHLEREELQCRDDLQQIYDSIPWSERKTLQRAMDQAYDYYRAAEGKSSDIIYALRQDWQVKSAKYVAFWKPKEDQILSAIQRYMRAVLQRMCANYALAKAFENEGLEFGDYIKATIKGVLSGGAESVAEKQLGVKLATRHHIFFAIAADILVEVIESPSSHDTEFHVSVIIQGNSPKVYTAETWPPGTFPH